MAKQEELAKEIDSKDAEIQACAGGLSKLNTKLAEARSELHKLEARRGEAVAMVVLGRADPGEVLAIRERIRCLQAEFEESSEGREWLIERRKLLTDEATRLKLVDVPFFKSLLEQYEVRKTEYAQAYQAHTQYQASARMDDQTVRRRREAKAGVTSRREQLHSLARRVGQQDDLVVFLQDVEAEG